MCVNIRAGQELKTISSVDVSRETQFAVEYKWAPQDCKYCKVFGHNTETCITTNPPRNQINTRPNTRIWIPMVGTIQLENVTAVVNTEGVV